MLLVMEYNDQNKKEKRCRNADQLVPHTCTYNHLQHEQQQY